MAISGIIIKTAQGKEQHVADRASGLSGLEIAKVSDGHVAAVLEGPDLRWMEQTSMEIMAIDHVMVVLPTYVNNEAPESLDQVVA